MKVPFSYALSPFPTPAGPSRTSGTEGEPRSSGPCQKGSGSRRRTELEWAFEEWWRDSKRADVTPHSGLQVVRQTPHGPNLDLVGSSREPTVYRRGTVLLSTEGSFPASLGSF